ERDAGQRRDADAAAQIGESGVELGLRRGAGEVAVGRPAGAVPRRAEGLAFFAAVRGAAPQVPNSALDPVLDVDLAADRSLSKLAAHRVTGLRDAYRRSTP